MRSTQCVEQVLTLLTCMLQRWDCRPPVREFESILRTLRAKAAIVSERFNSDATIKAMCNRVVTVATLFE